MAEVAITVEVAVAITTAAEEVVVAGEVEEVGVGATIPRATRAGTRWWTAGRSHMAA